MKKLYLLFCLIALAVGLSGCIAMATGGRHHPRSTEKPPKHESSLHAPAELREQVLFGISQSPA
jgi:hypothetical protein